MKLSSFSSQYRLLSIHVQSSESLQRMPSSMRHRFHSSKVSPLSSSDPFRCRSNNHRSRESCRVEYTVFQPILAAISADCAAPCALHSCIIESGRGGRTDGRTNDGRTFPPSILSRDRRKTRSVAVPINSPVRPVAMMESLDKSYTYFVALQPGKREQSSKNVSHARFQPWVPPKERANVALLRQADVT